MPSFYTLRVSRSDISLPAKARASDIYVKITYGDQSLRTRSVNDLPPTWNETFPITCSENGTRIAIELKRESFIGDRRIGYGECVLRDLLTEHENSEDISISLQSKSRSQHSIFLRLRPSDETKNAEITLVNLARTLLDVQFVYHDDLAEDVNIIFDTAKRVAESNACQSLVELGYTITAFVDFGGSIADASPYLKVAWSITTAFLNIIATQINTDKRIRDLVKSLMELFSVIKDTSVFNNPSDSLSLTITSVLVFITECSDLIQDYARKNFFLRALMQQKKAAVENLEATLGNLKNELESAFIRQDIIEARVEARVQISEKLKKKIEKKLQPKHEGRTDRQICLEGTRVEVLKDIEEWIHDTDAPNVFFILGRAGTGKSTIATTIAEKFQRRCKLGSHQYFLRGKSDPAFIFRTIAFDLAKRCQRTANAIDIRLDANEITTATPERAFEFLLFDPLHEITMEGHKNDNILIVLDALDECGSRDSREPYIRLIKERLQTLPLNYRFLITGRPEEDIASSEELEKLKIRYILLDHELNSAKDDVLKYLHAKLGSLKERGRIVIDPSWPWDESIKTLGDAAGGLFIWAATAVRLIESKKGNMGGELKRLVRNKSLSLVELYATALESSLSWDEDMKNNFSKVFSLIMFSKEQLSDAEINDFLGLDYGSTRGILNSLHSLVAFDSSQPVRLYHTSLYDYLISEGAHEKPWFIDEGREKAHISQRCFKLMEGLRFNMCKLETSYQLNKDVPGLNQRLNDNISISLLYSCRHWASHLREVPYSEDLCKQLESFALNRLLYWVEVLSITGSLYGFLSQSLKNSITWVVDRHSRLTAFLRDAHDQLLRFIEPISQSIPHLYMSFLPLMREDSIVAEHYAKRAQSLTRVEYVGNKPKMACTRQINIGSQVNSISYSPDGERIASVSQAGAIEIWDVVNGKRLLGPFQGHSDRVTNVAYSGDGRFIATGSWDKTVRVWNAATGDSAYGPLTCYSDGVTSVAFSGDGKLIASGSDDKTVTLWDAESGAPVGDPLRGHSRGVGSIVFSPNGCYLASGSKDCTIIVWDIQTRKMASEPFKGHSELITSLSFSPDSNKIASGSWDCKICIWEVSSGKVLHTFSEDGMEAVLSVAYSSDGKHILSGSSDIIVRVWDAEDSDAPPKVFEGHTGYVMSVSFVPDGKHFASGSWDGTIRVWDIEGGVTRSDSGFKGHTNAIRDIAISSQTGKYLVSGSSEGTVCVWDTESGDLIKGPLFGHFSMITSVAFSSNENDFASGSMDGSLRIWNMIDNRIITYSGYTDTVLSLAFSPDGKHLASGSDDKSIRVWSVESRSPALEPLVSRTNAVYSVCYSPDGVKIVSRSADKTVCIWNALDGNLLSTFKCHSDFVHSVAYSRDGTLIVSGSDDKTVRVWYPETGQVAYGPKTGPTDRVELVCFSPDGKWIISVSEDKTVRVWNTSTRDVFFQSRVPSYITSVTTFSTSDSKYIKFASGSDDGVIHIWTVNTESEEKIWRLEDSGWLTGNNGKLLIWIPPDLRHSLVHGPCTHTLNTRFSTKLHLSANQGDQWTACFPPPDLCVS